MQRSRPTELLRMAIALGDQETAWCSYHQVEHPRTEFGTSGGRLSRYCRAGKREYARERRAHVRESEKLNDRYWEDPEYREKVKARARLSMRVHRGTLLRGNCAECGTDENVHGHHEDYDADVIVWLCDRCHSLHHRRENLVKFI